MTPSKRTKNSYDDANKALGAAECESEDNISSFGTVDHIASSFDFEDDNPDDEVIYDGGTISESGLDGGMSSSENDEDFLL